MTRTEKGSRSGFKVGPASRLRVVVALVVAGLLLVPAAISWACGPNRAIQLDRFTYCPRVCDVNVTGAEFKSGATVDIMVDGAIRATTTVSPTGNLSASFKAPASPGTYAVRTEGVDPDDAQALKGTGNTVMMTVAEEAPPAPAGGGPAPAPAPGANSPQRGSPAPSRRTTSGREGTGRAGDNNRSASGGEQLGRAPARDAAPAKGGAPASAGAPADAGVNTTEGTTTTGGRTAFAGSVTQATRAGVAERAAKGASPGSAAGPSERSAEGDLWNGLTSQNPSLVPADGAGVDAPDTAPGLAWGMGLLAAGLLALIGLGVAEVTRRRRAPAS